MRKNYYMKEIALEEEFNTIRYKNNRIQKKKELKKNKIIKKRIHFKPF